MKKINISVILIMSLLLLSCNNSTKKETLSQSTDRVSKSQSILPDSVIDASIHPQYAEGFKVRIISPDIRLLDIRDPQSSWQSSYKFALIKNNANTKEVPKEYTKVKVPVDKVLCMTTLQLSNFICLDAIDKVTGITSSRYLFNEEIKKRIDEGKIMRIGIEGNFDTETILAANPNVIFISPFKRGGYAALQDVGIPLIPHLGYKEKTPLGQAEWIKFVAMLIGDESNAITTFNKISQRYNDLKQKVSVKTVRPTILSGEMRGGNWYAVGGKSFLAQLFKDAGADYFLKDDENSGGMNLDYETVYSKAVHADYWRIVNSYNGTYTYDVLKESDIRYSDFDAFQHKGVIYCNMRETPFYETMPVEPDVVLADLISIFHPEILPHHKAHYYRLLK